MPKKEAYPEDVLRMAATLIGFMIGLQVLLLPPVTFAVALLTYTGLFLAAEDKSFYEHGGLDFYGMARAGVLYAQNYGSNRRPQGASSAAGYESIADTSSGSEMPPTPASSHP